MTNLEKYGFAVSSNLVDESTIENLTKSLMKIDYSTAVSERNGAAFGVRNLLNLAPSVKDLAESLIIRNLVEPILGRKAKVVRAIFFNKTPDANWKVPWHQDLTIAVKEKREVKGFTAWTKKAGIQHVQPPVSFLEKMLTVRVHLDDADETNGALKVISTSHQKGRLSAEEILQCRQAYKTALLSVKRGSILLMRPLLLHSSSAGTKPKNRRIVHLEFSAEILPDGLEWYGS